ncbi:hypothetical protein HPP92_011027 [Vanilla planifolia]|uniref:PHD-type domain-containing protein n=1 Tax=Vanilla planifolia TaxID=51239 RepID=A0A835QWT6_VANPL|nr:hypothetical protein HPP92_011027 [Vanilla planifolia]
MLAAMLPHGNPSIPIFFSLTKLKAKICDMCGGSGYFASILTCCLCKINSEHVYCRLAMTANVPEFWYCDECLANADVNRKMQALDGGEEFIRGYTLTDCIANGSAADGLVNNI